MNKIHPLSQITTLPEFDLFSLPPTQLTIERNFVSEHSPASVLKFDTPIEFVVNPSIDEYIHLKDSLLYMKIKINIKNKDNSNVLEANWKKIQPVNMLLHSLFRSIELEIDGKNITMSPQLYPYKAYFETYLGFTREAKMGYLTAAGVFEDEEHKEDIWEDMSMYIRPDTITTNGDGIDVELMGKLHLDMAFQPRALLGGCKLKFTLIPHTPQFYLWNKDDTLNVSVEFKSAKLYLTRSKVAYPIVEAHNMALTKGTAKYPIMRGYVKQFTVGANQFEANIPNAIFGQIPRRVFLALVSDSAYNGSLKENPYNFKHYNANYVVANIDGVQYPTVAYQPNFTTEHYTRELISLYETLNQLNTDPALVCTYSEYLKGNTIFAFDFAPDGADDCNKVGYVNPIKHGTVNFQLKFATALPETIIVLIYCEYDNLVQIDGARKAITDYI